MTIPSAYTTEQVAQYEEYVSLPKRFQIKSKPALDLAYLTALHIHQISSMPYENLILHYSTHHSVSLDPQALFKKMVIDARGRGGYCMENSILFNHILRALGWDVYTAGVRIRPRVGGVPQGDYIGWVHIVNIVTSLTGERYMLDVGFGGDGATAPLPLVENHITTNLGTQQNRLIYSALPSTQAQTQSKYWIYQYRNTPTQDWNSFYAFPELEFLPQDFDVMNWYTSTSTGGTNFQTKMVLTVRFLRGGKEDAMGEEGIIGKVMLVGEVVKRNDGGKTRVVMECRTEEERVRALKEHFAISLTEEEIQAVKGRNVALADP